MSLSRPFAVSVGLATGLVAAVGFYTAAAGVDAPRQVTAKPQSVPAVAVITPEPVVSLAPCVKPAKLEHGACVTHKVVTKVIPAPAPARAQVQVAATVRPAARPAVPVVAASQSDHGTSSAVAATPRKAPSAAKHEDSTEPKQEVEHEDANHEDTEGTEAGDHGEDHGNEPGDDAGEHGDD